MSSELINNLQKHLGKPDTYWIILIHREILQLLNSTSLLVLFVWLFPGDMAGGYNLRNKQADDVVDDVGDENTDKCEDFEMSIDEQTDISPAAFISSLKSQVQYLKGELKLKNEIILNLSEAVKSLGRNEITSSAVNKVTSSL